MHCAGGAGAVGAEMKEEGREGGGGVDLDVIYLHMSYFQRHHSLARSLFTCFQLSRPLYCVKTDPRFSVCIANQYLTTLDCYFCFSLFFFVFLTPINCLSKRIKKKKKYFLF